MADIKDFHCTHNNAAGINREAVRGLGLSFPEAYLHHETMIAVAKALKEFEDAGHCALPFDHTLEAEALGGVINYGDENAGPRAKEYLTDKIEDLCHLPEMDFSKGRIHEVLLACQKLRQEGEQVVLEVSGPITVLNVLIDAKYLFKAMRKQPELIKKLFAQIGDQLMRYINEAEKYGVQMISYADSVGGVNILGPRLAEQMVEDFTYDFVRRLAAETSEETLILLCPKISLSLLGTQKAVFEDQALSGEMTYPEGCMESIGKIKVVGQQCVKNIHYQLRSGKIKEVVLK